jgi:hypothetical protein
MSTTFNFISIFLLAIVILIRITSRWILLQVLIDSLHQASSVFTAFHAQIWCLWLASLLHLWLKTYIWAVKLNVFRIRDLVIEWKHWVCIITQVISVDTSLHAISYRILVIILVDLISDRITWNFNKVWSIRNDFKPALTLNITLCLMIVLLLIHEISWILDI